MAVRRRVERHVPIIQPSCTSGVCAAEEDVVRGTYSADAAPLIVVRKVRKCIVE